jgi:L-rhamnose mutarotase
MAKRQLVLKLSQAWTSQPYTGGGGLTAAGRKRVCFQMKFDTSDLPQYLEDHKSVWPEMQEALRETGWHNYSLFYRPDGFAIGYYETENDTHQNSCDKMDQMEVNARWQEAMKKYTASGVRPDEDMQVLEQYFYLGTDHPSESRQ